jgi:predicted RNase H-like HicB family nuclease
MRQVTYTVHIEPAEEGGFVAFFPELPGCQTQGETFDEVIAMAKDALAGYLEALQEHGQPIPEGRSVTKQVGFEFPLTASVAR